jgi:hypothetical protein
MPSLRLFFVGMAMNGLRARIFYVRKTNTLLCGEIGPFGLNAELPPRDGDD